MFQPAERSSAESASVTLFLCGDVMTGRGIDQILPHPGEPHLYEPYMRSALGYVQLAEQANGPIPRPVDFAYIWGDALAELERVRPHARIINLETSVTAAEDAWPDKGIHYRMHPANVPLPDRRAHRLLRAREQPRARLGHRGLRGDAGDAARRGHPHRRRGPRRRRGRGARRCIERAGPGPRAASSRSATDSSGVPRDWAARAGPRGREFPARPLRARRADAVARRSRRRRSGPATSSSPRSTGAATGATAFRRRSARFAHAAHRRGGVDVVHGHSSHHPKGIEVYRERLILYGCGDFLNDYEGIRGHEAFRADLALMYFPTLDPASGRLMRFALTPTRIRHFRVNARRKRTRAGSPKC